MPPRKSLLDSKILVALDAANRSLLSGSSYLATGKAILKILEINVNRLKDAEEKDLVPSRLYKAASNSGNSLPNRGSFRVSQIPPQLRPLYKVIFEALLNLLDSALKQAAHATKVNLSTFPRAILEDIWEKDTVSFMEKQPKVCLVVWVVDDDEDANLSHYDERDLALFIFPSNKVSDKLQTLKDAVTNYKFDDRIRFAISAKKSKDVLQQIVDNLGLSIPVMINSSTTKASVEDLAKVKPDVLISGRDEDFDTFCRFAMLLWIDGSDAEDRKTIRKRAEQSGVVIIKTPSTEKGLKYLETHGFLGGVAPFRIIVGDSRRADNDKAKKESKRDHTTVEGDEDLPAVELVEIIRSRLRWHTPLLVYYERKDYFNLGIYDFKNVRLTSDLTEASEFASMKPITWAPDLSYYRDGEALTDKRGILKISSIRCNDLAPKDSNGLSDPYINFQLGDTKLKAPKILEELNPVWNELNWEIHCKLTDKVSFDIWDWDRIGSHDFEGRTEFDLSQYLPFPLQLIEITRRLTPRSKDGKIKDEVVTGTITIQLGFDSIEQKLQQSSTAAQAAGHSKQPLGRHFGRPLEESLRTANEAMELHLIDKAIAFIRSKALKTQGVFRLPGNATKLNELRARFDEGEDVDLDVEDEYDVPSLLKMYFRELPDPLLPAACFSEFMAASKIDDRKKRVSHFAKLFKDISLVPIGNRDVLIDLVHLMDEIAGHEEVNKMTHRNLATCLAPTIIIPNGIKASPVEVLTQTKTVTDLLEFVIVNHENIFKSILSDDGGNRRKSARELSQNRVDKRSGGDKDKKEKKSSGRSSSKTAEEKDKETSSPRDRSSSISSRKSDPDSPRDKKSMKLPLKDSSKLRSSGSTKSPRTPRGSSKPEEKEKLDDKGVVIQDLTLALFEEPAPIVATPQRRGLKRTNNSGAVSAATTANAAAAAVASVAPPQETQVAEDESDQEESEPVPEEDDEIERLERELREAELREAELLREAEIKERNQTASDSAKDYTDGDDFDEDDIEKKLMEEERLLEEEERMLAEEEAAFKEEEEKNTLVSPKKAVVDDDDGFNPDAVDLDD